jgi:hypothetical protein
MTALGNEDLTARLNALREVLHNEIGAAEQLLGSRVDAVGAQREILLAGLNERTRALQTELDRRLVHLYQQVDERFEASKGTIIALKEMLDERYATQTKALDAAFKAAEQAVAVALANAEKATTKAEAAADKRFDAVNEFRAVLTDQTKTFISRSEWDTTRAALDGRVSINAERLAALELRLTSRLDLDQGRGVGEDRQGAEEDRQGAELRLNTGLLFQILAVVISVAAIAVVIILHGK